MSFKKVSENVVVLNDLEEFKRLISIPLYFLFMNVNSEIVTNLPNTEIDVLRRTRCLLICCQEISK